MKYSAKVNTLVLLVQSLSKAEKRYFQLYSSIQNGEKSYLQLFDLICSNRTADDVYNCFCQKADEKSFETAVKHLYRVLMDCLIRLREKEDIQTHIFNYITKAGILFERELFDEAFTELNKAKKLAITYENDPLQLLIRRTELKYLSTLEFEDISERELVTKQMKINDVMKYSRNTNLHLQLYDILKHRIIYKGYARSNKQKEDLNDLVLSELNLIANSSYQGFEPQKLHLLFQATYYLNTGNYKSAIRLYQELITLFEENKHLILNPPIYYLSAIEGILDSLHVAGLYNEMPFFLTRLKDIAQSDYASEFILEVQAHLFFYELATMLSSGHFTAAKTWRDANEELVLKKIHLLNINSQLRVYLYSGILSLCYGDISDARKSMKKIFSSGKLFHTLPLYKTARLINLLVQAESGNYDFFENEINSIKRNIQYEKHVYATEKLLFRFIMAYPLPSYEKARNRLWTLYKKDILKIRQDKYERQLLKTFDILSWIESKLTGKSLAEVIQNNESLS